MSGWDHEHESTHERPGRRPKRAAIEGGARSPIGDDVARGLSAPHKSLPPYLFYDEEGSRLYELITALPEYYPTRTERANPAAHAAEIVALTAEGGASPLCVVELGAGTASKTRLVLDAVLARQGRCVYGPIDVSASALAQAQADIRAALPSVDVHPFHGHHHEAFAHLGALGARRLVLFIGSSIGNYEDAEASALLTGVRRALGPGGALLLGTDLRKSPARLVPAYDDAAGVTAAFNKNVLARLNRELGARFELARFRHVALWNREASRIEMHLESVCEQRVPIEALDMVVSFAAGERIHTESSIKYDLGRVDALFAASGLARVKSFSDPEGLFAVHLARAAPRST